LAKTKYRIWMWVLGALAIVLALVLSLVPIGPKGGPGRRVVDVLARDPAAGAGAEGAKQPAAGAAASSLAAPADPPARSAAAATGDGVVGQAAPESPATRTSDRQRRPVAPRRSAPRPVNDRTASVGSGAAPGVQTGEANPSASAPVPDDLDPPAAPTQGGARPGAPRIELIPDERAPAIGVVGEPK